MKIWLLKPYRPEEGPWDRWYDKAFGFVVEAETEAQARGLASEDAGDEGKMVWLDMTMTSCNELVPTGTAGIILRDFAAA